MRIEGYREKGPTDYGKVDYGKSGTLDWDGPVQVYLRRIAEEAK